MNGTLLLVNGTLRLALAGGALLAGVVSAGAREVTANAAPLDATVVIMGEQHDIARHHLNQADWVRSLSPAAIVFEMLPAAMGPVATRMASAPEDELEAALEWTARGWTNFPDYYQIFRAAGDARIYGAEVPRARLNRAVESGAGVAMGAVGEKFGLDTPLDPDEQATREAEQARAHCGALPEAMLGGMVEAQRLRDATLAETILAALDRTGGPVAVITGNGHARRDWGVPRDLSRARPQIDVISIGQFTDPVDAAPHDAWVVDGAPAPDAADPCDAFREGSAVVLPPRRA